MGANVIREDSYVDGCKTCDILRSASLLALKHKVYFYCVISVNCFFFRSVAYISTLIPQRWRHCIWLGYTVTIFPTKRFLGFTCPALVHVGRYLMHLLSTLL